jgi:hypothetical protein
VTNEATGAAVSFERPDGRDAMVLPRGAFLFVGGDTAYHIADYATLAERIWAPFWWACAELPGPPAERPLFGIPGNHDYYDALHGFDRQFQRTLDRPTTGTKFARDFPRPPLDLPAFTRIQDASYVALELPFGWWFWGLDTQHGRIDLRQRHFFEQAIARAGGAPPDRLIVATPEPHTVFHRSCGATTAIAGTFASLGLVRPFLEEPLPSGKVRLDLAGDVHHYARYWGPASAEVAPSASNYAAVVAGLGGAFLHPTYTRQGRHAPQSSYPSEASSRATVARALFDPVQIVRGGLVWLFAAVIAVFLTFGITPSSTRAPLQWLIGWLPGGGAVRLEAVAPGDLEWLAKPLQPTATMAAEAEGVLLPAPEAILGLAAVILFVLWAPARATWRRGYRKLVSGRRPSREFVAWHLLACIGLLVCAVALTRLPGEPVDLDRALFYASILILGSLAILLVAIGWSSRYTEVLGRQGKVRPISKWDYVPTWIGGLFGAFVFGFAHWKYGHGSVAAMGWSGLFTLSLAIVSAGLVGIAYMASAQSGWKDRVIVVLLGVWHAVLQALLPLLLVAFAPPHEIALACLLVVPAALLGYRLAAANRRWLLLGLWLAFGVVELAIAVHQPEPRPLTFPSLAAVAGLGALFGCVWFGWYLAVASLFNAHNNEVGGAARIERFKQIVRIRLRGNELTAFVIAFDEPAVDAARLQPRLADVFRLRA